MGQRCDKIDSRTNTQHWLLGSLNITRTVSLAINNCNNISEKVIANSMHFHIRIGVGKKENRETKTIIKIYIYLSLYL